MNFKALAATAAVAVTSLFTNVGSANAASGYCYTTETGGDVCITRVVQTGAHTKRVWSVVDGDYSVDDVYCNPAYRNNYKDNMWGIACYEFN